MRWKSHLNNGKFNQIYDHRCTLRCEKTIIQTNLNTCSSELNWCNCFVFLSWLPFPFPSPHHPPSTSQSLNPPSLPPHPTPPQTQISTPRTSLYNPHPQNLTTPHESQLNPLHHPLPPNPNLKFRLKVPQGATSAAPEVWPAVESEVSHQALWCGPVRIGIWRRTRKVSRGHHWMIHGARGHLTVVEEEVVEKDWNVIQRVLLVVQK